MADTKETMEFQRTW